MNTRAHALAERVLQGAQELIAFVETLSEGEWQTAYSVSGPTVAAVVHHVANDFPGQIEMVRQLASGQAITGLTVEMVDQYNAQQMQTQANVSQAETLDLLRRNSALAAEAIRALSDEELDQASPISLYGDIVLTTQYFIEDCPISHSYHHLADIRAALKVNISKES